MPQKAIETAIHRLRWTLLLVLLIQLFTVLHFDKRLDELGTQSVAPHQVVKEAPRIVLLEEGVDYKLHCDRTPPGDLNSLIDEAAAEFEVDSWMLAATVYRESDCREGVTGSSGEIGLTQVNPKVWLKTLKAENLVAQEKDLFDPRTNLRSSAFILNQLSSQADSEWGVFRRYNGSGPKARAYATEQVAALAVLRGGV